MTLISKAGETGIASSERLSLYGEAIQITKLSGDLGLYIRCLNDAAAMVKELNQTERMRVLSWLRQSIPVLQWIPDDTIKAIWHYHTGFFYSHLTHNIDTPLFHLQRARQIFTEYTGASSLEVAKCYHVEGDVNKYAKRDFLMAEQCYEKALQIFEALDYKDIREMARIYYNLATTNRSQGDYERAVAYGIKTTALVNHLNDPDFLERTYSITGNIYRDMGDSKTARDYYLKAIALNSKAGVQSDLTKEKKAWHYVNMGETFAADSMFDLALSEYEKASAIYKSIKQYDQKLFLNLPYQIAYAHYQRESYAQATIAFNNLLSTLREMNIHLGYQVAEAYMGLGDVYKKLGSLDSAGYFYQQALVSGVGPFKGDNPSDSEIRSNYFIHRILSRKADLFNTKYTIEKNPVYLRKAFASLVIAERLISLERNTLDVADAKWRFLDANYDVYEQILGTLYRMVEITASDSLYMEVFRYMERSKARSVDDALNEAERRGKMNIPDSIISAQSFYTRELSKIQDELSIEMSKVAPDTVRILRLREEFVNVDRHIQRMKLLLNEKYPGYHRARYRNDAISSGAASAWLAKGQKVMIEYFFSDSFVYGFCISEKGTSFTRLGKSSDVNTCIQKLLHHYVDNRSSADVERFKTFVTNSHAAYKLLVAPFESMVNDGKSILIIPDGPLAQIPFESLLKTEFNGTQVNYQRLDYLIHHHRIGYSYAFNHLDNVRQSNRNLLLLAMGYVDTGDPEGTLPRLNGAEQELKFLAENFKAGKFYTGDQASEQRFKHDAGKFDLIHLAVHGRGNIGNTNNAALYFKSQPDSVEDNVLHAYELYGLNLRARLAVLSACESGIGASYKGEGLMSMANAFVSSGSENVLMSLWNLNDQTSYAIVSSFYESILDEAEVDEALAKAKLKFIMHGDELTADPRNWAPLVAYGQMNQIMNNQHNKLLLGAIVVLIIMLTVLMYKKRLAKRRHSPH